MNLKVLTGIMTIKNPIYLFKGLVFLFGLFVLLFVFDFWGIYAVLYLYGSYAILMGISFILKNAFSGKYPEKALI